MKCIKCGREHPRPLLDTVAELRESLGLPELPLIRRIAESLEPCPYQMAELAGVFLANFLKSLKEEN
jgi:hypothetical protein